MAQHDLEIGNQSGLAVRQDLNALIAALASQNSGNTAPESTLPFLAWIDTGGAYPILKFRNSADTAWVTVGRVDREALGLNYLYSANAEPSTPQAFMQWVDTNGANPILKIRNAANDGWVTIGRVDLANFGMMLLTGGVFSGAISFSNTDHIKLPVGTTGQRAGSPESGMIRYNSTLGYFEGYSGGAWGELGSGGGGGGSLTWEKLGSVSPVDRSRDGIRLEGFSYQDEQSIFLPITISEGYRPGQQIKLMFGDFFIEETSGDVLFQAETTLIKKGVSVLGTYPNKHTSTNSEVAVPAVSNQSAIIGDIDLCSTNGQINSVAIDVGDKLIVKLTRKISEESAPAEAEALLMINNLNLAFKWVA